jgi:hypothetical protein
MPIPRRSSLLSVSALIGMPARRTLGPAAPGTTVSRRMRDDARARSLASAMRLAILAIAAALPVLSISAHVFGVMSMDIAARYVVLPVSVIALILAGGPSQEAVPFRRGVLAGLVAVTAYDATRMPFVLTGVWPDFIPDVGGWVAGTGEPNALLGYLWRYVGNGGGIGAFFTMVCAILGIRRYLVPLAVGYGVFVWSGLMGTVALSANGETLLFEISALSVTLSLIGHLVYGSVLGWVYARMIRGDADPTPLPVSDLPPVAWVRNTRAVHALT